MEKLRERERKEAERTEEKRGESVKENGRRGRGDCSHFGNRFKDKFKFVSRGEILKLVLLQIHRPME